MKNSNFNVIILLLLLCAAQIQSHAQGDWNTAGNNLTNSGILGGNTNFETLFRTDGINRMQLLATQTSTINGFPTISQGGYLGLSDEQNLFTTTGAFSMLHLNGDNAGSNPQQLGWRPWMKYGMTITSNRDLMYVGQLDRGTTDETDAVIAWSDNVFGAPGPDNLRFLFTSGDGQSTCTNASSSEYGLEAGRFSGEGRFGCGDFSACGVDEQPTHQLDVNGEVRVRSMQDSINVLITGVAPDTTTADGDYVLSYLALPDDSTFYLAGDGSWMQIGDCDWELIENFPDVNDVITGHGTDSSSCYPVGHVGIGTTSPDARLEVYHGPDQVNPKNTAVLGTWREGEEIVFSQANGIVGVCARENGSITAVGVGGSAFNARNSFGGDFLASPSSVSPNTNINCGVRGRSIATNQIVENNMIGGDFEADAGNEENDARVFGVRCHAQDGAIAYGIYSSANGGSIETWAGYFAGEVFSTLGFTTSDESLKQNIETLEGALDIIQEIQPRQYEFQVDAYSQMNLPTGQQQGVVAQELEEILPNLVKQTTHPAQYDTLGNEITPAVEFKSVNYIGLIPYLIAGMQEQQQQIGALEDVIDSQNQTLAQVLDQLDDLQQQINNCCSVEGAKSFGSSEENPKPGLGENILHQNNPNPFRSQTTISYELEQGGKVTLDIFDKNGKPLATLVEAEQQAGEYRYEWDASGLPAGVYNYALYVDGKLLVKKAIKLTD